MVGLREIRTGADMNWDSHMEWELLIPIVWDVMQHYWLSDFQHLKGMLGITYPAMQCHIPKDQKP